MAYAVVVILSIISGSGIDERTAKIISRPWFCAIRENTRTAPDQAIDTSMSCLRCSPNQEVLTGNLTSTSPRRKCPKIYSGLPYKRK